MSKILAQLETTSKDGYCPSCDSFVFGETYVEEFGYDYLACDDCQDEDAEVNNEYHILITLEDVKRGAVWYRIGAIEQVWREKLLVKYPDFCEEIVACEIMADGSGEPVDIAEAVKLYGQEAKRVLLVESIMRRANDAFYTGGWGRDEVMCHEAVTVLGKTQRFVEAASYAELTALAPKVQDLVFSTLLNDKQRHAQFIEHCDYMRAVLTVIRHDAANHARLAA